MSVDHIDGYWGQAPTAPVNSKMSRDVETPIILVESRAVRDSEQNRSYLEAIVRAPWHATPSLLSIVNL